MTERTTWTRIMWPDDGPLPSAGAQITIGHGEGDGIAIGTFEIVDSRVDFEPGWIQVEIRPAAGPDEGPRWERIPWPEDSSLPEPGLEITIGTDGTESRRYVVLGSLQDAAPGWIQVRVRPVDTAEWSGPVD